MNARYYLPSTGRFLSADTIVPSPTTPQSWNRYSYVLNNPLKYIDPSGHCGYEVDDEATTQDCIELRDRLHNEFEGLDILGEWSLFELQVFADKLYQYVEWVDGFDKFNGKLNTVVMDRYYGLSAGAGCYGIEGCRGLDHNAENVTGFSGIYGSDGNPYSMDTVDDFGRVVSHELTHAFLNTRQHLEREFADIAGWTQNQDGSFNPPTIVTNYGNNMMRPDEDLAEWVAVQLNPHRRYGRVVIPQNMNEWGMMFKIANFYSSLPSYPNSYGR